MNKVIFASRKNDRMASFWWLWKILFTSKTLLYYSKQKGLIHDDISLNSSESNGCAECLIPILMDITLTILTHLQISGFWSFWAEMVKSNYYLENSMNCKSTRSYIENKSTCETLRDMELDISNLVVFWCKTYMNIPKR